MEEKQPLTTEERRKQKIAQLKAKLQKEEARLNQSQRKERNGQLIAFGVLFEQYYRDSDPVQREAFKALAEKYLKDRNLTRALAGFERLKG